MMMYNDGRLIPYPPPPLFFPSKNRTTVNRPPPINLNQTYPPKKRNSPILVIRAPDARGLYLVAGEANGQGTQAVLSYGYVGWWVGMGTGSVCCLLRVDRIRPNGGWPHPFLHSVLHSHPKTPNPHNPHPTGATPRRASSASSKRWGASTRPTFRSTLGPSTPLVRACVRACVGCFGCVVMWWGFCSGVGGGGLYLWACHFHFYAHARTPCDCTPRQITRAYTHINMHTYNQTHNAHTHTYINKHTHVFHHRALPLPGPRRAALLPLVGRRGRLRLLAAAGYV